MQRLHAFEPAIQAHGAAASPYVLQALQALWAQGDWVAPLADGMLVLGVMLTIPVPLHAVDDGGQRLRLRRLPARHLDARIGLVGPGQFRP